MKPLIGILPLVDVGRDSYWMLPGYMKAIESVGGAPMMLPLTTDSVVISRLVNLCSGIVIPGGQDVSPAVYDEEPIFDLGETSPELDEMEDVLLREALFQNKPVLGICRGIQFINAALGGTLYQDIPTEVPSEVNHLMKKPYNRIIHNVNVEPDGLLASIVGAGEMGVNSYHHQAIKDLADTLKVEAVAEDGIIEAVSIPNKKFFLCVQWHPEFDYKVNTASQKLFTAFVDAAR